jgi:hypothetical protein
VASENGSSLNLWRVIPGRGCVVGVVGPVLTCLPVGRGVINHASSRTVCERPAGEGKSPVGDRCVAPLMVFPSSAGPVKSRVNLPGPPGKAEYFLVTDSARVP